MRTAHLLNTYIIGAYQPNVGNDNTWSEFSPKCYRTRCMWVALFMRIETNVMVCVRTLTQTETEKRRVYEFIRGNFIDCFSTMYAYVWFRRRLDGGVCMNIECRCMAPFVLFYRWIGAMFTNSFIVWNKSHFRFSIGNIIYTSSFRIVLNHIKIKFVLHA